MRGFTFLSIDFSYSIWLFWCESLALTRTDTASGPGSLQSLRRDVYRANHSLSETKFPGLAFGLAYLPRYLAHMYVGRVEYLLTTGMRT